MKIIVRDAIVSDGRANYEDCQARGWQYAYGDFLPAEIIARVKSPTRIQEKIAGYAEYLEKCRAEGRIQLTATNEKGAVVGFLGGGATREENIADAELYGIYLNPDFIGCGAGRALMEEFIKRILKRGAKSFYLECFSENKSLGFYKHMGGRVLREYDPGDKYAHHMISIVVFDI